MSARLGLSSGSVPALTAAEISELTRESGGTVVDLRAGKGHTWEVDGTEGLVGVAVAFIGVSVVLGRPDQDSGSAHRFPGRPIKVFAEMGAVGSALVEQQIAELTRDREPDQVLLETHRGHAGPIELLELCERYGCRLVIDNMGLAATADDFHRQLVRLSPYTAAVQVKGFASAGDRPGAWSHRPLESADLSWLGLLGKDDLDITVESRAGVPGQDLEVLRKVWEDLRCA
jgi:hypothetical protein